MWLPLVVGIAKMNRGSITIYWELSVPPPLLVGIGITDLPITGIPPPHPAPPPSSSNWNVLPSAYLTVYVVHNF